MKVRIRMAVCAALAAIALYCAVGTISSVDVSGYDAGAVRLDNAAFVLAEYNGNVAVFTPGFEKSPLTVTEIEVSGLRAVDRDLISRGLVAYSKEELLTLLEDLGS